MAYKIKNLFEGRQLLGCDSSEIGIKDISTKDKEFSIRATSDRPDRFKDIVVQEGLKWMPNWWPRNPIVAFAHNYSSIPVAKGVSKPIMERRGKHTYTSIRVRMGSHPEALQVWGAIQEGLLSSASIGFLPIKQSDIETTDDDEKKPFLRTPQRYEKAEILEVSIVPVPANPDAHRALKQLVSTGALPAYIWEERTRVDKILEALEADEFDEILSDVDLEGRSDAEIKEIVKLAIRSIFKDPENDEDLDIDIDSVLDLDDDEADPDDELFEDEINEEHVTDVVRKTLREALGQLD